MYINYNTTLGFNTHNEFASCLVNDITPYSNKGQMRVEATIHMIQASVYVNNIYLGLGLYS